MRINLLKLVVLTASATCSFATAATVTFNGFSGTANGTPFSGTYTESNFTVSVTQGSFFVANVFGNPVPSIYGGPIGAVVNGTIEVKQVGGGAFTFNAFDFASNNGSSSYSITGNGGAAFTQNGTVGAGSVFSTVASSFSTPITTLDIAIIPGAGTSSFNIDNIVVTPFAVATPEPSFFPVLSLGFASVAGLAFLRRRTARI